MVDFAFKKRSDSIWKLFYRDSLRAQKFRTIIILFHNIFIISQLWSTSHPRSAVVLLDTGTPGTNREISLKIL